MKLSAAEKTKVLRQIEADIIKNNVCQDLAQQATKLVFGDGDVNAELVFVGEAPGKNEDLQGIPFVGSAGKFLNEMLASINLNRSEVYITNIVKYRPPGNRDPLPEEKAAFLPYLLRQLAVIQPKILITLGRHSMEYFLPGRRISEVHGRAFRKAMLTVDEQSEKVVLLPLFHPAAALYDGSMRSVLEEDFRKIPAILNKINETK